MRGIDPAFFNQSGEYEMHDIAHWAIMCVAGLVNMLAAYLAATQSTFDLTLIGMGGTLGLACFIWGGIMTIRNI